MAQATPGVIKIVRQDVPDRPEALAGQARKGGAALPAGGASESAVRRAEGVIKAVGFVRDRCRSEGARLPEGAPERGARRG